MTRRGNHRRMRLTGQPWAKPWHDGGGCGERWASSRTREVRALLFQLQPTLFGRVQLVALAGEQGAGLRGLGGVALVERGVGESGLERRDLRVQAVELGGHV